MISVRRAARRLALLGAAALPLAVAGEARAQTAPTITITQTVNNRFTSGGAVLPACTNHIANPDGSPCIRDTQYHPLDINFNDCENDIVIEYTLTLSTTTSGYVLGIFAGTNCNDDATRNATNGASTCWHVQNTQTATTPSSLVVTEFVRVRDIVAGNRINPIPPGRSPHPAYPNGTEEDCRMTQLSTAPLAVTLYFMFLDPTGTQLASGSTPATTTVNVALISATPPLLPPPGVLDTALKLSWAASADTNVAGYNLYCDPTPGNEMLDAASTQESSVSTYECPDGVAPFIDSGTTDLDAATDADADDGSSDADADDGSSDAETVADAGVLIIPDACVPVTQTQPLPQGTAAACGAPHFPAALATTGSSAVTTPSVTTTDDSGAQVAVADAGVTGPGGVSSPQVSQFLCATTAGQTASGTVIKGLQNNSPYNVAIATYDSYGNIGALSTPVCGIPELVDDFWDVYRRDGGRAGGGFCSVEGTGMAGSLTAMLLVGTGAIAAIVRRRRK